MKIPIITLTIVLSMALCASAQNGGGLFKRGAVSDEIYYGAGVRNGQNSLLALPNEHGSNNDSEAAPLGGGALLLIGFGAAYTLKKRKK